MNMLKLLAWGGVLLVAICFSGCTNLDPVTPATPVTNPDFRYQQHYHISVSAEGAGSTMPFDGVIGLWLVSAPATEPPDRDPDNALHWYEDGANPTLYGEIPDGGSYLLWQGYQTESPPDSGWVRETDVYCVWASGSSDYYGSCIFGATK